MQVDYLGHSEFILSLENEKGEEVRILCDAWLSDYAVWDMMGRNPTFKLDYNAIPKLDAIFLSHSHTDHVDPYTLIELYKNLEHKPALLVPEVIAYLIPLFNEYLDSPEIIVMKNKDEISFKWIGLLGYVFETNFITNEDDVMGLFAYNNDEIIFNEVDLVPPEMEEVHNYIYKIFMKKNYKNRAYIATRNELEWNLKMLDIANPLERKRFASEYKASRKEEIEYEYYKHSEGYVDYSDILNIPGLKRVFIGQWICYPKSLNTEFLKLAIMPLSEEVEIEKRFAKTYWKKVDVSYMKAGKSYDLNSSGIKEGNQIPYLLDFDFASENPDLNAPVAREYANGPLNEEERNPETQEKLILEMLNTKFLPYRFWNKEDCLKSVILWNKDSSYKVLVKFWYNWDYTEKLFVYSLYGTSFEIKDFNGGRYDEDYYANDLEDFLTWRQELYSNFHHKLNPEKAYRVWTALWANYINNDILINKFKYHFEAAKAWKTSNDFVLPVYTRFEK